MSKSKTIVVVAGYWSTNIGNSFFQLGAEYLLKQVFPNDNVVMLCDQPGYWNVSVGNPLNSFNLLDHIKPDYLVILGPFLRSEYKKIWSQTLQKMHRQKVKIIVLGAGMMRYDQNEVEICRKLLAETPPYFLATRDSETYENFADLAEFSYDGIDPAFFVGDLFNPLPIDIKEYVILNFDQIPEPKITISDAKSNEGQCIEFQNKCWNFKFPAWRSALSKRFKFYPFIEAFIPGQDYPEKIGNYPVIRTDHRFNPMLLKKSYKGKNSFVSDFPFTYLNLYAHTTVTFSNRVHACVATLAYGKPAMLFSSSLRMRLLERLGLNEITRRPVALPQEKLALEKEKMKTFLNKVLEK